MPVTHPFARAPQQARSAETTRRLLAAAAALLEERSFDDVSVTEVAERAGVTIGAFYARFGDKDGLLRVLESQMMEEFSSLADAQTAPQRWTGRAIEEALHEHHLSLIRAYRTHRGIARALVLRSHSDPQLRKRIEKLNQRNLPRVAGAIAKHCRISNPSAQRALEFSLLTVRSVCRETILFKEGWPGGKQLSDAALARELTRMIVGYLGVESGG